MIGSIVLIKIFLFLTEFIFGNRGQLEKIIKLDDWSLRNESTEKLYFSKISIFPQPHLYSLQ